MQSLRHTLRSMLVAVVALALVSARPVMLLSHSGHVPAHGCRATTASHGASHTGHHCSATEDGDCCDACLGACAIGGGFAAPPLTFALVLEHVDVAASHAPAIVRVRRSSSLRLPPPFGPPRFTRS